jgi:hypothetical protein
MIKRLDLPKGIITMVIPKLVRTLAGCLKMQEVVTMGDIRLPEFDKNRRINQQKVLVFDSNNIKYDIILGTNFLSKTGIKLNYSNGNMEWFDCSIPLLPPGDLELTPWKTCFTSKSETSSLVKIGSNALQQRFWMPSMKGQMYLRLLKDSLI